MQLLRCFAFAAGIAAAATTANAGGSVKDYERPFSWTGFYVGLHGGAAWSDVDAVFTVVPASPWNHKGSGGFVGGQVGYNWQMGSVVLGIEADGSVSSIEGDAPCPNPAFSCGTDIKAFGSVRGRLGVATFGGRSLLYATGGWGWANVEYSAVPVSPGGFKNSETLSGWVVGGGWEWAALPNTSIKFEYLAYVLGDETLSAAPLAGNVTTETTFHTAKIGLNYKF